ncbi:hypothetical protein MNBD_GAMMA04-1817 [hydrothermal vent metagenome]|uniref:DUF3149 domain-containing protein n=1 Tax=hydrothermal vent metagenome TaxID=652676 RepID=A0A3B0WK10_9ZZZZ
MPDMESVGSALLLTLGFVGVSIIIVGLAMWGVFRFFKNNEDNSSNKNS